MSTKPANEARADIAAALNADRGQSDTADRLLGFLDRYLADPFQRGELFDFLVEHWREINYALREVGPMAAKLDALDYDHPAAPADAGDAERVVEALERLEWCDHDADQIHAEFCPACGSRMGMDHGGNCYLNAALAAARRLLDAPPGVGERMREALEPFADAAKFYEGQRSGKLPIEGNIKIAHLRADRDALAAPAPAEPEKCKTCGELHDLLTKAIQLLDDEGLEDTAERMRCAMRATMRAPAASSAAEGSVATREGGE